MGQIVAIGDVADRVLRLRRPFFRVQGLSVNVFGQRIVYVGRDYGHKCLYKHRRSGCRTGGGAGVGLRPDSAASTTASLPRRAAGAEFCRRYAPR